VSPTRTVGSKYIRDRLAQMTGNESLTKLALREGLEELEQTVLACVQDLRRLRDIDRPHLQASDREVAEQVVDIGPGQLHRRGGVVVECHTREGLQPMVEELRDSGDVHVGLDERVVQALVGDVDLRDPQHVVDIGDDRVAAGRDEDDRRVARAGGVVDGGADDLNLGAVLGEVGDGDKLVNLAEVVSGLESETGGVGEQGVVHIDEGRGVGIGHGKSGQGRGPVVEERAFGVVKVVGLEVVDDVSQLGCVHIRLLVDEAVESYIPS
jgi:hypothetical protein